MWIELKDIHKHYGSVKANNGVTLTIKPGTIHGVLGENGAGKSTLMKVLAGYIGKTSGRILVNGSVHDYHTPAQAAKLGIGMLYQEPLDFPPLTVLDNFMIGQTWGIKNQKNFFRKRPGIASMSGTELLPRELWLSYVSHIRLSPVGLTLVTIAIVVTALMLRYTKTGLYLKAIGSNLNAAHMFDLAPRVYMLIAMIFAGGFAGLAGSIQVTSVYHRLLPAISSNYGYLALLVVMLSN